MFSTAEIFSYIQKVRCKCNNYFYLLEYAAAAMVCPLAEAAMPIIYRNVPTGAPAACNHVAPLSDE